MSICTDEIKMLIFASGHNMKEVADHLGLQKSVFSNRFARENFSAEEIYQIAEFCGAKIKYDGNGLNAAINVDYKHTIQHLGGNCYDTDKAVLVIRTCKVCGGQFSLFRDARNDLWFVVIDADWMDGGKIEPMTAEQARAFYVECGGIDADTIFGKQ